MIKYIFEPSFPFGNCKKMFKDIFDILHTVRIETSIKYLFRDKF